MEMNKIAASPSSRNKVLDMSKRMFKKAPGATGALIGVGLGSVGLGGMMVLNNMFNRTIGMRHHLAEGRKKKQFNKQIELLGQIAADKKPAGQQPVGRQAEETPVAVPAYRIKKEPPLA